ncbi:MAG: MBL fold metallo-hydrolase [Polyangiaceae bacterium]
MKVRFFGVRGSVAVPGPSTMRYGGNTVCVEVRLADGTILILDAGTGIRELGNILIREEPKAPLNMLLTHLHWDHIIGLPFFKPLYRADTHLRLWPAPNEILQRAMTERVLFDGIHFPIRAVDIPAKLEFVEDDAREWRIGSATVRRIGLNHPGGAQGFRVDDADGKSVAYLTDNELSPPGDPATSLEALARFASDVTLLIHDAQYVAGDMPLKRGWGHSTVDDVLRLAKLANTPDLFLFHHEPERDDDALDALGVSSSAWLAENAKFTRCTVAREGLEIVL